MDKLTNVDNMKNYLLMDPNDSEIIRFLSESNGIENVRDLQSLGHALVAWGYLIRQPMLTAEVVLKTHRLLMKEHLPRELRGTWRREGVMIGGREGLDWHRIPDAMAQWIEIANKVPTAEFAAEWNKQAHIQYEHIHPFIDGNGRTGRMFYLFLAIKHQIPFEFITEGEKLRYYAWF